MGETGALGVSTVGSLVSTGFEISGGILQSNALKSQGKYQRQLYNLNADTQEILAKDAIARGEKNVQNLERKSKQFAGAQRSSIAAQGIEVDTGSAKDVQEEVAKMTTEDVITIRNNAWREAWGHRFEAQNFRTTGLFAEGGYRNYASNTLLTSGLKATQSLSGLYNSLGSLPSKNSGGSSPAPYEPYLEPE